MEKFEHKTVNGIHVASLGCDTSSSPSILFLHGFPELWLSWRHQMEFMSARGFRCHAPDLRGYGESHAPAEKEAYSPMHIVGDLTGVLDSLGIEKAFVVGHDWGAMIAWNLCLFRPDRVNAVVNLSVAYFPRSPKMNFLEGFRAIYGEDFYIVRFQEPGRIEELISEAGTEKVLKFFYTSFDKKPPLISKNVGFKDIKIPENLPSWLSDGVYLDYAIGKFNVTGFTGGLNYYRAMNLTWELTAPWTGAQIKVPAKFITGDEDLGYNLPGVKEYIGSGGFKRDVPLLEDIVIIKGASHFINQSMPDEINAHIYDFIKKF